MTGLVLKLKPFEKLLINGAVIQNGARASRLRVRTEGAHVLRLRDAMHPSETASIPGKIYYVAQLALAGEADADAACAEVRALIEDAADGAIADEDRAALARARDAADQGRLYAVMRAMKPVLARRRCASGETG